MEGGERVGAAARGVQAWCYADVARLLSSVSPLTAQTPTRQAPGCPPESNTPCTGVTATPGLLVRLKEAIRKTNKSAVRKHTSFFSPDSDFATLFLN